MATAAELAIKVTADTSGAQGSFKKLSKGVALAGAGAAVGIAAFSVKAVQAAADVGESQSKVNAVFGESAGVVTSFADNAASALGTTKGEALAMTGTIGNMLTALGQTEAEAADMSTSVVGLAADLGSFNNLGTEEVLEKLRAGLSGEAEPLKSLGVAFGAADVEARALAMGLAESKKEITESDKIAARYALIMEQTGKAQGDMARTADGLPNSMKAIKSSIGDTVAEIGAGLLPAFEGAGVAFRDFLQSDKFDEFKDKLIEVFARVGEALASINWESVASFAVGAFDKIIGVIDFLSENPAIAKIVALVGGLVAAFAPVLAIVGPLIPLFGTLVGVFSTIAGAVAAPVAAITPLIASIISIGSTIAGIVGTVASAAGAIVALFNPVSIAILAIVAVVIGLALIWKAKGDEIKETVGKIVENIKTKFAEIVSKITGALDAIKSLIRLAWDAILRNIADKLEAILGAVTAAWDSVVGAIQGALDALGDAIRKAWDAYITFLRTTLDAIVTLASTKWEEVKTAITTKLGEIKTAIETKWAEFKTLIETALGKIITVVGEKWEEIKTKFSTAIATIKGYFDVAEWLAIGEGIITGLVKGFSDMWNNFLTNTLGPLMDKLPAWVKRIFNITSPSKVFARIGEQTADGFFVGFRRAWIGGVDDMVRLLINPFIVTMGRETGGGIGVGGAVGGGRGRGGGSGGGGAVGGGRGRGSGLGDVFRKRADRARKPPDPSMFRTGKGGFLAASGANYWKRWVEENGGIPDETLARQISQKLGLNIPTWLEDAWKMKIDGSGAPKTGTTGPGQSGGAGSGTGNQSRGIGPIVSIDGAVRLEPADIGGIGQAVADALRISPIIIRIAGGDITGKTATSDTLAFGGAA